MTPLSSALDLFSRRFERLSSLQRTVQNPTLPEAVRLQAVRELDKAADEAHEAFGEIGSLTDDGTAFAMV
jgi:hypothetical protein